MLSKAPLALLVLRVIQVLKMDTGKQCASSRRRAILVPIREEWCPPFAHLFV
jgi:hypothetical protein